MFKQLHKILIFRRRVNVLSAEILSFINPTIKTLLDVWCGDGAISKLIQNKNKEIKIVGIDVMERPTSSIIIELFDGENIPYHNDSFDCTMLIDVLHHVKNIKQLLTEAKRVSKKFILIKDHQYKSNFDLNVLKFMDYVGNKPHNVIINYNFLNEVEWNSLFDDLGLEVIRKKIKVPLYLFPFNILFGRKLHFICLLQIIK